MSSNDEILNFVRRAIVFARAKRGLSDQTALAEYFDVHPMTVSRLNNGHWSPVQTMLATALVEFCQALHNDQPPTP